MSTRHRMPWVTALCIVLAALLTGAYWLGIQRPRLLPADHETVSPDGQWRVTHGFISEGQPMQVLIRIYDARQVLRGETVREIEQGGADDLWRCDAGGCTAYRYGLGPRAEAIALPPSGWVKVRAAIP
jgi:hypothetical protein